METEDMSTTLGYLARLEAALPSPYDKRVPPMRTMVLSLEHLGPGAIGIVRDALCIELGESREDSRHSQLHVSVATLLSYRYPRNVAWTDLPMVAGPYFKTAQQVMEGLSLIVVLLPPGQHERHRMLAGVSDFLATTGMDIPVQSKEVDVTSKPTSRLSMVCAEDMAEAVKAIRPQQRFTWTWHMNVKFIMPSLLAAAYKTRRPPGSSMFSQHRPAEDSALNALSNPFALQALYLVQAGNPYPLPYTGARRGDRKDILRGAGIAREAGSQLTSLTWAGMEDRTFDASRPSFDASRPSDPFSSMATDAVSRLSRCGLLLADANKSARLGPPGAALLNMLPRGCRDLGMPGRWTTSDGGLGRDEDIPAMDRWLTGTLRRLVRAASALGKPQTL